METLEQAVDRMVAAALKREKPTTIILGICRPLQGRRLPPAPSSPCPNQPCQFLAVARSLPAAVAAVEEHRAFERSRPAGETIGGV